MTKRTLELMYPKQVDDYRVVTKKMLKEMVLNGAGNHRFPIALGHDAALGYPSDSVPAAGKLSNIRLDDRDVLLGDAEFQPEVDEAYANDKYVGWSLGIVHDKKDGWKIDHLALLGSRGAAYKDLQEITGQTRFSLFDCNEKTATVVCFGETPAQNKTVWLLESEPRPNETKRTQGENKMSQELKDQLAAQKAELEKFRAENAELEKFRAENARLVADANARAEKEKQMRVAEFSGIKGNIVTAMKAKGVAEDCFKSMEQAIDNAQESYVKGDVTRSLFDAMERVISSLGTKVPLGESGHESAMDDQDLPMKTTFTGQEAVSFLSGSKEA